MRVVALVTHLGDPVEEIRQERRKLQLHPGHILGQQISMHKT